MNKKLFLIGLFLCIASVESFSTSNPVCTARKHSPKRAVLLERLIQKKWPRSSFIPYIVAVDSESIDVTYLQESSTTTVEIFNQSGECIYNTTVNLETNSHLSINIEDWDEGIYTIYFKDSGTDYVTCGIFEL